MLNKSKRHSIRDKIPLLCLVVILVALLHVVVQIRQIRGTGPNQSLSIRSQKNENHGSPEQIAKSAFPSSLYDSAQTAKRSAADCLPRGIHLSQASNVESSDGTVNVTVSFMLDFDSCGQAKPQVVYGQGAFPEGVVEGTVPLQFNYTSKETPQFHSDYIFHVLVPNLQAGNRKYWYEIVVQSHRCSHKDDQPLRYGLRYPTSIGGSASCQSRRTETRVSTFWTPPLPGQATTLALLGDLGQTENSTKTMAHIWRAASTENKFVQNPVTQLLIVGDMSYADSDALRWPSWFALMEPLLRSTLLQVAVGNHEIECDTETRDIFVPYEHYFRVPNRLGNATMWPVTDDYRKTLWHGECSSPSDFEGHYLHGNSFYSYTHGLAKIIVLNSYTDTRSNSTQYKWLEGELQHHDSEQFPWLIVAFHSPLYTTFLGHVNEGQSIRMRRYMEHLFVQYNVNFIISGHDHACKFPVDSAPFIFYHCSGAAVLHACILSWSHFLCVSFVSLSYMLSVVDMRTYPMYNGSVVPSGRAPIYLTLGAGGNREHHARGFRNRHPESWVAKRDNSEYGYGHVFLPNATHAKITWVRDGIAEPKNGGGLTVYDSVWIRHQYTNHPATAGLNKNILDGEVSNSPER